MPIKGYKQIEAHIRKRALANSILLKGRKRIFTEEWKRHISESKKGQIVTEETKSKISKTTKGKPKTKEHRINISKAKKELYKNPKNHSCYKDGRSFTKGHCIDCKKEILFLVL